MYEKLSETIRVPLKNVDLPDFYVLVVPSFATPRPTKEFFLVHDTTGFTEFMFGYNTETDEESVLIAERNAPLYISNILERKL
jgi:hypothetical protein